MRQTLKRCLSHCQPISSGSAKTKVNANSSHQSRALANPKRLNSLNVVNNEVLLITHHDLVTGQRRIIPNSQSHTVKGISLVMAGGSGGSHGVRCQWNSAEALHISGYAWTE